MRVPPSGQARVRREKQKNVHAGIVGYVIPPGEAKKAGRRVYWKGEWLDAEIFEMDRLEPGNTILGLAVIEAPATTMVVPPDRYVVLDEHMIFHMKRQ